MVEIAGALYLVSTFAFAIVASVVGVRLLLLYRQSRGPEGYLGLGLIGTAGLGYGVMMVAIAVRGIGTGVFPTWHFTTVLLAIGWIVHNLGVMAMLRFVLEVFRPGVAWARTLARCMSAVMWIGWLMYVVDGGLRDALPRTGYWLAMSTIGTYPLWAAFESFRYHDLMKRRLELGLADALVTNRFRLWGLASLGAAISIWMVNVPALSGLDPSDAAMAGLSAVSLLITALVGTATVLLYWLTFFPPGWYRSLFAGGEGPVANPAARNPG